MCRLLPRYAGSPKDSVKTGGEVGNISLQSVTHGSAEPHGLPAESEVERAERQAEAQFQELVRTWRLRVAERAAG